MTIDDNAIWRAIVDAISAAPPSSDPREVASSAIARLHAEQSGRTPSSKDDLDRFVAAFTALDVSSADIKRIDMADRIDHSITIGVTSHARLSELAIALDLSRPENHIEGGYAWWQSQRWQERGTSITIQAHRPRKTA